MSLVKNLCEVGYDYRVKNRVFNATIRCVLKKRKIVIHIFSFLFADAVIVKVWRPCRWHWSFLFFRNFCDFRQWIGTCKVRAVQNCCIEAERKLTYVNCCVKISSGDYLFWYRSKSCLKLRYSTCFAFGYAGCNSRRINEVSVKIIMMWTSTGNNEILHALSNNYDDTMCLPWYYHLLTFTTLVRIGSF